MKRKYRRGGDEEPDVDMTPMLDVTFILLIFFIVTTSFVSVSGIDVTRPSSAPPEVKQQQKAKPIVIRIMASGTVLVNQREVSVKAIGENVQKGLAVNPDATVIVVASGRSPAGLLVTAIDQARNAGAKKVSIASAGTS